MKKLFAIVLIIIALISTLAQAKETEFLSVWDSADMLRDETERYIYTQNRILSEKTGARIIIATALSSGELSLSQYADNLYAELGVKSIGRGNSIFILLCRDEADYCIKVSDALLGVLSHSDAHLYLVENMEKDFAKGDYDSASIKTYNALADWYKEKYHIDLSLTEDMTDYENIVKTERERELLRTILIAVAVVLVSFGLAYALIRYRRQKRMRRLLEKRQERRRRYAQALMSKK